MKFDFFRKILFTSHLLGPSYESVAKDWNIPSKERSGDVSWFARKVHLKGKHVWVARPSEPKEKRLLDILKETCREMGIRKVPRLLIYADYDPNAASESFTGEILISTNLADIMSHDQLKAILGHELDHYRNRARDTAFTGANLAFWGGVFAGLKHFINKYVSAYTVISTNPLTKVQKQPWFKRLMLRGGNLALTIAGLLVSFKGLSYVHNWYHRRVESEADLAGAKAGGVQAMADSLQVLDKRVGEILEEKVPWGEAKDPNEAKTRELDHPRVRDRIKKILHNAPASGGYAEKETGNAEKNAAAPAPAKSL